MYISIVIQPKRGGQREATFPVFIFISRIEVKNIFILKILLIDFLKLFLSEISLKWIIKVTKNKVQAVKVKLNIIHFCHIKMIRAKKGKCFSPHH